MNWIFDQESINWEELSKHYKIAPLGEKKPEDLKVSFPTADTNVLCLINEKLVGVGRALADDVDCCSAEEET